MGKWLDKILKRDWSWLWLLVVFIIPIIAVVLFVILPPPAEQPITSDTFKPSGKMNWAILLLAGTAAVIYLIEQFMSEKRRPFARGVRWFCIFLLVTLALFSYFPEALNTLFTETLDTEYRRRFVVVTGAFLAVYPVAYLAYSVNVQPRLEKRLEEDIQLLGLDNKPADAQVKALFRPGQFWLFIIPIIVVSLVIVFGYLMPEKLPGGEEMFERPMQLVFFSLLGAYVFSVQELVRRYQTNDLRPHVYATILVRIVIAAVITFAAAAVIDLAGAEAAAATPTPTVTLTATNGAEAIADSPTVEAEQAEATQAAADAEEVLAIVGGTATIAAAAAAVDVTEAEVEATVSAAQKLGEIALAQATATAEAITAAEVENSENGEPIATPTPTPDTTNNNETSDPAPGAPDWAIILAFLIGMVPARGTRWLSQRTSSVLGNERPVTPIEPLSNLAGISQWHESRLLEMGIDDVQNLATANILELLLTTRFSAEQIVNWIDQAILYTRIGPEKFVQFRSNGINTYSDYQARLNTLPEPGSSGPSPAAETLRGQLGLNNAEMLDTLGNFGNYANYPSIRSYYRNRARYTENLAAESLADLMGEEGPDALTPAEQKAHDLEKLRYQETSLKSTLRMWPEDAEEQATLAAIRLNIGLVTADDAKLRQAVTDSLAALDRNPALVEARITLGWAYYRLREYGNAISACNVAIQRDATRKEPYLCRGLSRLDLAVPPAAAALRNTLLNGALADFNHARELDDRYADAYLGRGRTLLELNDYQQAIESFDTYYLT
jgi:tetratricopeptide (TPR) repeat protein